MSISTLEEIRKIYTVNPKAHDLIEFTLAFPQTPEWRVMGSLTQMKRYNSYLKKCVDLYGDHLRHYTKNLIITYSFFYEPHKNGNMHVHGVMLVPTFRYLDRIYSNHICDFAKYLCSRSKRLYNGNNFSSLYQRYYSPFCTIQYSNTPERLEFWLSYITKDCSGAEEHRPRCTGGKSEVEAPLQSSDSRDAIIAFRKMVFTLEDEPEYQREQQNR